MFRDAKIVKRYNSVIQCQSHEGGFDETIDARESRCLFVVVGVGCGKSRSAAAKEQRRAEQAAAAAGSGSVFGHRTIVVCGSGGKDSAAGAGRFANGGEFAPAHG